MGCDYSSLRSVGDAGIVERTQILVCLLLESMISVTLAWQVEGNYVAQQDCQEDSLGKCPSVPPLAVSSCLC